MDRLDIFLTLIFAVVQWRITHLLLTAARSNFSGRMRAVARVAILLFDALVGLTYFLSFSRVVDRLGIPTRFGMLLGALSLTYFITATGVLVLHQLLKIVQNRLGARLDPDRRRVIKLAANAAMAAPSAL